MNAELITQVQIINAIRILSNNTLMDKAKKVPRTLSTKQMLTNYHSALEEILRCKHIMLGTPPLIQIVPDLFSKSRKFRIFIESSNCQSSEPTREAALKELTQIINDNIQLLSSTKYSFLWVIGIWELAITLPREY